MRRPSMLRRRVPRPEPCANHWPPLVCYLIYADGARVSMGTPVGLVWAGPVMRPEWVLNHPRGGTVVRVEYAIGGWVSVAPTPPFTLMDTSTLHVVGDLRPFDDDDG